MLGRPRRQLRQRDRRGERHLLREVGGHELPVRDRRRRIRPREADCVSMAESAAVGASANRTTGRQADCGCLATRIPRENTSQPTPMSAAIAAATAAMPSAQRGPKPSATAPTMGAPIGVPPTRIAMYSAMHAAAQRGFGRGLHVAVGGRQDRDGAEADEDASRRRTSSNVGMSAAMSAATPKNAVARMMTRMRARSRRAASSAPVSEPIARIEREQAVLAGTAAELDRHRRREDREVHAERADEEHDHEDDMRSGRVAT